MIDLTRQEHASVPPKAENTSFNAVVERVDNLSRQLPIYYQHLLLNDEFLMVVGGIKGATDVEVAYEANDTVIGSRKHHEEAQKVFSDNGLALSSLYESEVGNVIYHRAFVYNPDLVRKITSTSKQLPVYSGEDLCTYIDRCLNDGVEEHIVMGLLYSFPESAIKFFETRLSLSGSVDNAYFENEGLGLGSNGESYVFPLPAERDVQIREQIKRNYFESISIKEMKSKLKRKISIRLSCMKHDRNLKKLSRLIRNESS